MVGVQKNFNLLFIWMAKPLVSCFPLHLFISCFLILHLVSQGLFDSW